MKLRANLGIEHLFAAVIKLCENHHYCEPKKEGKCEIRDEICPKTKREKQNEASAEVLLTDMTV